MPRAIDLHPEQRGAGSTSLYSPTRSQQDYQSALADTAGQAGEGILSKIEDVVNFIFGATGIDLSSFGALLAGLSGVIGVGPIDAFLTTLQDALTGLDLSAPGAVLGAIVGAVQPVVDAVVSGLNGGLSVGNDAVAIALALLNPMTYLQNIGITLAQLNDQLGSRLAIVEGRVDAVQTQTGQPLQSDNFNRETITGWTNVLGELAIVDRAFVRTFNVAAGIIGTVAEPRGPATDRHMATFRLTNKLAGACRAVICSDAAMTNYAAVEVRSSGYGADYARLVTGYGPNLVVARKQVDYLQWGLRNEETFSTFYDPPDNAFHVKRNGVLVPGLSWEDEDNIVTHGPTKRKVGVVSNADNLFWAPGFGITDFTFADVSTGEAA
ncbi:MULTISPECIES: hypothetical protein [unclassified Mycobacterium]|uniref:hypothetical protein n=1 Tax=unclassified Mycobacterium TaxID=2642494 RepID=UPI0029C6A931|nr:MULTISPECIES: hypothetical protein [unclassified Mycobacterium]